MRPPLKQRQIRTKPPAGPESAPRLPHERDESDDSQASEPREKIKQAYEDLEHGLVDTDLRGNLGVNPATRAPHNNPDPSPPAEGRSPSRNRLKLPDGK